MDELLRDFDLWGTLTGDPSDYFTLADVFIVLVLSFLLCLVVAWVYRYTHRGVSYSQSFAQTLVIMGTTVALIMLIIGSNIARAFALVGALSIIRFRNPVKESRDVAFIFLSMAIGMACGTRFYTLAIYSTAALSAFVVILARGGLFAKENREILIRIQFPVGADTAALLAPLWERYVDQVALVAVETVREDELQEFVFTLEIKRKADPQALLQEVRGVNDGNRATLVTGLQEIDL
jgi:hypothetical protein